MIFGYLFEARLSKRSYIDMAVVILLSNLIMVLYLSLIMTSKNSQIFQGGASSTIESYLLISFFSLLPALLGALLYNRKKRV
jgi:hypothetical protein